MVQRASFGKLQRDRDKKAKAAAKRERRQQRSDEPVSGDTGGLGGEGPISAADLLARVESLRQRLDDGVIDFDEFEAEKAELLARLAID